MVKNAFFYVIGLIVVGGLLSIVVKLALGMLPYLVTAVICLSPFYGAFRRQKQWHKEELGIKNWLRRFFKVFKFGKSSLPFYLILGIVIGFIYQDLATILLKTILTAVGGTAVIYIAWESARYWLDKVKNVKIPSFFEAVKGSL